MCNIGVRQGEHLSPLEQYFIDNNFSSLEECTESILHSLGVYIKLYSNYRSKC